MIEFKGELSKECKKIIHKRKNTASFIAMTVTCIVVLLPIAFIFGFPIAWAPIGLFALLELAVVLTCIFPSKHNIPTRIYIEPEDGIITVECGEVSRYASVEDAKEVVDHGDHYTIKFTFANRDMNMSCICQKDLLTSGSLEQFEEIFGDVLTAE